MLQDKVIVVTGAGSGIGEAAAHLFAGYGATLLLTDRDAGAVQAVAAAVIATGGRAAAMTVDVTCESQVADMVAQAVAQFGALHGAFNNAGVGCPPVRTAEQTTAELRAVLEVDLIGAWFCLKHEIAQMRRAGGGAIVTNASAAGLAGTPFLSPYAAAKAGVINMIRTAAMEYGADGIQLNAVCPGLIDTPALRRVAGSSGTEYATLLGAMALKRLGTARDVAELAAWLLADASAFVTGQAICVDGGFSASFS